MCDECARLQSENVKLRNENVKLRKQIKLAKEVIKKQKQQLDAVREMAWNIMKQAERAMAGHLPRGTWSLWKGRGEAAFAIFRLVIIDWSNVLGDLLLG